MLAALANVAPAERFNYYKGVGYLMRRLEYGGELVLQGSSPSGEEIAICLQYRAVLHRAMETTIVILQGRSAAGAPDAGKNEATGPLIDQTPAVLQAYCAQLLAVLAFRVPALMSMMLEAVLNVSDEDLHEVAEDQRFVIELLQQGETEGDVGMSVGEDRKAILSKMGGDRHAGISSMTGSGASALSLSIPKDVASVYMKSFNEVGLSVSDSLGALCPALFGWRQFHSRLRKLDVAEVTVETLLEAQGTGWIKESMHRSSSIFHLFFKYWLEHVSLCQDAAGVVPHVPFREIPPYRSLVRAFLLSFAETTDRGRSMTDCAVALISAEPAVVSFLFKTLFMSTDGSNFANVLDSLMQVEFWFKQLVQDKTVLPADFDYDFMCNGFDRILQMEHHVVTGRLLALIYNFSSVFSGEGRMKLFGSLLINKYGHMLFLSWDVNTRSIFHQLLIFKLLRVTRKDLQSPPPLSSPQGATSIQFQEDRVLLSKQEALLRGIKRQCEEKQAEKKEILFAPHWEAYYPRAMEEWNGFYASYLENAFEHRLQVLQKAPQFKA